MSRAALVTGASSGIGLAIAEVLAEEGHDLTLVDRDDAELRAVAARLRDGGTSVETVHATFGGDDDAVERSVRAHRDAFGRLDVLVNNVAVATQAPIEAMDRRRIDLQIDVNLGSVVGMYRAALPMLREAADEHGSAQVVNTASIAARVPEAGLSLYVATKGAVVSFTHAMNTELGTDGIKSCALLPGVVDTPMTAHLRERVPTTEMIRPRDLGELVRALLRLGPSCVVPEIELQRPGGVRW